MDQRLETAIATPRIQIQAGELVQFALRALEDLKRLDESLYERFVASREVPLDPQASAASLRALWEQTFAGMSELLELCKSFEAEQAKQYGAPEPALEADPSFDFGELEGGAPAEGSNVIDFGAFDVGGLLDGFGEQGPEGDAEKWAKVIDKVLSIEYGLRSQQTEALERMEVALRSGEINHVLGLLDDTCSSASEGVHALVSMVYETFLPEVNAATVVPGYLTSLGRALLVRRGLAELATTLAPYNGILQSDMSIAHRDALSTIRETMKTFVGSVVCRAMRPADRWQMVEFERDLSSQAASVARLTSEGLVKYLDSLGSINQREVLLIHDQRAIEQMRESVANARQLLDISPRTAAEMIDRAYQAAQRLRGRHPATDELVVDLEKYPPSAETTDKMVLLERLEAVLAASGS
ncbi:MAG: hypothetical protein H0T46_21155 [Deltaproteobacteria bacterium]|nr:hypothetical protein [Deltaproteobacteria bacterium]